MNQENVREWFYASFFFIVITAIYGRRQKPNLWPKKYSFIKFVIINDEIVNVCHFHKKPSLRAFKRYKFSFTYLLYETIPTIRSLRRWLCDDHFHSAIVSQSKAHSKNSFHFEICIWHAFYLNNRMPLFLCYWTLKRCMYFAHNVSRSDVAFCVLNVAKCKMKRIKKDIENQHKRKHWSP